MTSNQANVTSELDQQEVLTEKLPLRLRLAHEQKGFPAADGIWIELDANVSIPDATLLYSLTRKFKPAFSLEIGFAYGFSGMAILQAIHDNGSGLHYACDPFQNRLWRNLGLHNVREAGFSKLLQFSEKFPEEIVPTLPQIDFAFIDGSHLFDQTLVDFILVDRKLRIDGLVGFHDVWMPSQQKALRYILSNRSYQIYPTIPLSTQGRRGFRSRVGDLLRHSLRQMPQAERYLAPEFIKPFYEFGLGHIVFLRKTAEDNRDWDHHIPF